MKFSKVIAILSILMLSIVPIFASVIITMQTTTVSGPCTGTATLMDGSPAGLTTTYVAPCTGTITYQSTSTVSSSSSSTIMQAGFPLLHVYGLNGCQALTVPTTISHLDANLTVKPDQWTSETILSDSIHNYTVIMGFTTNSSNPAHWHTITEQFYINGIPQFDPKLTTVPVDLAHLVSDNLSIVGPGPGQPYNSDLQRHQFDDKYSDNDSGQGIWYGIDTKNIQFEQNLAAYPVSNFTPTDITTLASALPGGPTPTFSNQNLGLQIGQQFNQPTDILITHSVGPSPCATPLSNSMTSLLDAQFTQNWNSNTEILAVINH